VVLTNGSNYWLAIWSDDSGAGVYYSDSAGTYRWGQYNYGTWPDPISTSGGSTFNYCIYAFGTAPPVATNLAITIPEDTSTNLTLSGYSEQGPVTFAILASPTNGVLGALNTNNGTVSYTPNTNYFGPDAFHFTVNDGTLLATGVVNITVAPVNDAPTLPAQTTVTVDELTLMTVTNTAADPDSAPELLTYSLNVTNLLDGRQVTNTFISSNGLISWTPAEDQGPGTNRFTTVVTDNGQPPLSATNSFEVVVAEVNDAPALPQQNDRTVDVLTLLMVTNTATDPDFPANTLSYVLVGPAGASIDSNGIITWTPASAQGNSTNLFITVATDSGVPNLSATNSFSVLVNPVVVIPPPVMQSISLSNGVAIVTWTSVSNATYRLQCTEDLGSTNWLDIWPDVHATGSSVTLTNSVGAQSQRFYRVLVVPLP
jgi:hypothetical protein